MFELILSIALSLVSAKCGVSILAEHLVTNDKITAEEFEQYTSWSYVWKLIKEAF